MPVYVYRCVETEEVQELHMTVDQMTAMGDGWDESVLDNPAVTTHWRRVYTPPAVQFKGSGFYSNGG